MLIRIASFRQGQRGHHMTQEGAGKAKLTQDLASQGQIQHLQLGAAVHLGNGQARQPHFGQTSPQRLVIPRTGVKYFALPRRRTFVGQVAPNRLLEQFLLFT